MIITIDGPAASGKSTVAQALAQKLSCMYLSSGLLYRALAYLLLEQGYTLQTIVSPEHGDIDIELVRITYGYTPASGAMVSAHPYGDLTVHLSQAVVEQAASIMSTNIYVRSGIDDLQRTLARSQSVVVDGRDAGSIVFPYAEHKFFLTAPVEVRATRWLARQKEKTFSLKEIIAMIAQRDKRDSQRPVAPLVVPAGGKVINSTDQTVEHVVTRMVVYINR